jgi:hypothetical protein
MVRVVEGTLVPLDALQSLTDWPTIKKVCVCVNPIEVKTADIRQYHKLNNEQWAKNMSDVEETQAVDNIVTSTVAMKSVAT